MNRDYRRRQEEVLAIIVKEYVTTAEPVGSRFVARRLGLSSATIRNVMADLEDMGFVTHPHTSAGRAPTDKGYRYYIDSLMSVRNMNAETIRSVEDQYKQAMKSLEDVLERTSHLLSSITNYVGVTFFPQNAKVYLDGTSHIIEQPEFKDLKKLHSLIRCLEEKRDIFDLLNQDMERDDLAIHIGRENRSSKLSECSVVTRGYRMKGKIKGRVGVIGPKRMFYEKVIPAVDFLADTVTEILEELEVE